MPGRNTDPEPSRTQGPKALSIDEFLARLEDSGVLPADEARAVLSEGQTAEGCLDGEQLAQELVRRKMLTSYQAQAICQGKGKGLVLGNYVVLEKLGQGGMGIVFKAEHRRMRRIVAIKVLPPAAMKSPEARRRFRREVEAAAKLEHPNVCTAYDADEAGGVHFLVMQYIEGRDLSAFVRSQGPMSINMAVRCVIEAASGLEYAHQRGVIHRDVKPSNILLDREGNVKVLDLGLARLESTSEAELTSTGDVMGTVDYMAPEQGLNTKNADARSDIYSLGHTLWFLLVGKPAYPGNSMLAKMMAHRDERIPSLRVARPDVPAVLDSVFQRMVAKHADERFQSMTEVISALQAYREDSPSSHVHPSLVETVVVPALGRDDAESTRRAPASSLPAPRKASAPTTGSTLLKNPSMLTALIAAVACVAVGFAIANWPRDGESDSAAVAPVQFEVARPTELPVPPRKRPASQTPEPAPPDSLPLKAEPVEEAADASPPSQPGHGASLWLDPNRDSPLNSSYHEFQSSVLRQPVSSLVWFPPAYSRNPEQRFSVIYWLHGQGGTQRTFAESFLPAYIEVLKKRAAPPAIIVAVNGVPEHFYGDSVDGQRPMESVIIKDLIPNIDKKFRTIATREGRLIEGVASGGLGAARLGFKYPEVFGAIVINAAFPLGDEQGFAPPLLAVYGSAEAARNELPETLAKKHAEVLRQDTFIRILCFAGPVLPGNERLHKTLDRLEIPHTFVPLGARDRRPIALFYQDTDDRMFNIHRAAFDPERLAPK